MRSSETLTARTILRELMPNHLGRPAVRGLKALICLGLLVLAGGGLCAAVAGMTVQEPSRTEGDGGFLPLPATCPPIGRREDERGEGWGEGYPTAAAQTLVQAKRPSSPQPSPPSEGGEGEEQRDGAFLPLPARDERGEGRGEGYPIAAAQNLVQAKRPSSPQPSPPPAATGALRGESEGGEGAASPAASLANSHDWWSLQPLQRPTVPQTEPGKSQSGNPIDAFIHAKLAEKGLAPSPPADRRTLIRRVYFDVIGLPPTVEEIQQFIPDPDPQAYEKLVDGLLASPRYGERWARHWLDLVHYGETHGYDKDKPRLNAWPYRDYVIRAFNEDKPYSRFVQEQVAGDVLFPFTADGIEALGFLAAGPWDFIGHEEVPETKIDGKVARHLDRDDMVMNTIQTFNSLTVQCAQCHNHKFDPIPQEDYYSLQAVFAAIDRANKKYDADPAVAKERAALENKVEALLAQKKELNDKITSRAGQPLIDLDRKIAALEKTAPKSEAFGYHSAIEKSPDGAKWVQVDLGHPIALSRIVLHPCKDDFNNIGEGFGFPVRFKVEVSDDAGCKQGVTMVSEQREDFPNPKLHAASFEVTGREARYIRVTATKLAPRMDDYIFALAELSAFNTGGKEAARGAAVTALDSIEAPARWQKANLTDGWYPGASVGEAGEVAALRAQRTNLLANATEENERERLTGLEKDMSDTKLELDKLRHQSVVFAGVVHKGSGNFIGTGGKGGQPRPIFILNRGDVQKPGKEVGPGALEAVTMLPARFDLPPGHSEGARRAALAKWLTDAHHPLTWRSIVNRLWQYHFGRGLVETPNDFGRMGALPTHPELLEWLAVEFRDGGQSFKKLHKLILTSATYRQSSAGNPAFEKVDGDNRFLWRMNRRKLEAEAVRDSVLFVSGQLDLNMGGAGFQDFVIDKPEHSPHYEYQLHDPEDPKSHRRSIYRFIVRSQQEPLMTALDCADPSMQVGRRNESVSPLQALALLNNALMLAMSKQFAAKLEQTDGDLSARVGRAYYEAVGQPPGAADLAGLAAYAREFGLANFCRVLFNLNEFAFVD